MVSEQHNLYGEIGVLTRQPSIATVRAVGCVEACVWNQDAIEAIARKNSDVAVKFQTMLIKQLVNKLASQNKHRTEVFPLPH